MTTYELRQNEVTWQVLLNCPEAKVLGVTAERELLIELHDCREQILAACLQPIEKERRTAAQLTEFQLRVRELASSDLSRDPQTAALAALAQRYQEVRTRLALANVRLVAHVAKRYYGRGIPPSDLIQEGVCALLQAIDRFDVVNETRLATYAIWWIRQGIQRAVAAGAYPVRLNPRQLSKLARAHLALSDPQRGRSARFDRPGAGASQTVEHLLAATRPTLSLDALSRFDGTTAVVDFFIPLDEETEQPEELGEYVGKLIKTLDPREQLVLKLRFGLKGESRHSLIQVGRILGVSKERVRQLQDRALRKLRSAPSGQRVG
jgi:RNA polymerase primary sigma factor